MHIGILGTRGIPNHYGGFEQFAEYLSVNLVKRGHRVSVYNSHLHPYQEKQYKGVNIVHIYDPTKFIGAVGQFVYDFLSIHHARTEQFDIILQLGYGSSSIFFDYSPKSSILITNMDGLEWTRSKYSKRVQKFLEYAERLATQKSDCLVADSLSIQSYLKSKYKKDSLYIPYGVEVYEQFNEDILSEFKVEKEKYNILIARLEPENSIEMILNGVVASKGSTPFLVIGNHKTKFGKYLKNKFTDSRIRFLGTLYDIDRLHTLRAYSSLYFHGHSVGGTNPSLLEAMASRALICAHDNPFNRAILEDKGFYFNNEHEITNYLNTIEKKYYTHYLELNREKIKTDYHYKTMVERYEALMYKMMNII